MKTRALVVPFVLLFACGGTSQTPIDGGSDVSMGDGGCIAPVEGQSCSQNDVACQPAGDICCVGYMWSCQSGAWKKMGVGCACQVDSGGPSDFACGPSLMCSPTSQVCLDQAPGIPLADGGTPPDTYSCGAFPTECANDHTCACLTAHDPCPTKLFTCDDTQGALTAHCMGQ